MARKVRHPYQVLDASEMAGGQHYAFVHASENGNLVSCYAMGGVFADSLAAGRRLGHDLASVEEPRVEMLVADSPSGPIVTVHMDGWWYGGLPVPVEAPTLVYWRESVGGQTGWDMLSTYLGSGGDSHNIVVPVRQWDSDPRLHAADWDNPDGVVERALAAESAAGWEQRMRAKAHAAMARALGF